MRHINHSVSNEFTSFIPTHVLDLKVEGDVGAWVPINKGKENFLSIQWIDTIHTIVKLHDNIVCVVFNTSYYDNNSGEEIREVSLYKGGLK